MVKRGDWRTFYWKSGTYWLADRLAFDHREPGAILLLAHKDSAELRIASGAMPIFLRQDFAGDHVSVRLDGTGFMDQESLRERLKRVTTIEWEEAVQWVDEEREISARIEAGRVRAKQLKGTW